MVNTETFYIIPNTTYRCYPIPNKFENAKIKSIYKYINDGNHTRILIIVTCDLQSQNNSIMKMLKKECILKNDFELNLEEINISFIMNNGEIYGPEYFFIIPEDNVQSLDDLYVDYRFVCSHGYWNLQENSDFDMTILEYNNILNTDSAKILEHLDGLKLHGNAIELDKESKYIKICDKINLYF